MKYNKYELEKLELHKSSFKNGGSYLRKFYYFAHVQIKSVKNEFLFKLCVFYCPLSNEKKESNSRSYFQNIHVTIKFKDFV